MKHQTSIIMSDVKCPKCGCDSIEVIELEADENTSGWIVPADCLNCGEWSDLGIDFTLTIGAK